MLKRLLIFFILVFSFSVSCFASSFSLSNYQEFLEKHSSFKYACLFRDPDTNGAYVYCSLKPFYIEDGVFRGTGDMWYAQLREEDGVITGTWCFYENISIPLDELILYDTNHDICDVNGNVIIPSGSNSVSPPQSAPVVDYNLSTESVLSVIIQLIPTILVFLVLYWGFWKGYSMLLRILGKA